MNLEKVEQNLPSDFLARSAREFLKGPVEEPSKRRPSAAGHT